MAATIYMLCALTSLGCAVLLARAFHRNHYRLLVWSSICFSGLTINNLLLVVDKVVLPTLDLSAWRTLAALIAMAVLLYGLIWDSDR